jgi:Coenzyme F390 synthetase
MDYRRKIFTHRDLYDLEKTDNYFLNAVRESILFHEANCPEYAKILQHRNFNIECLESISDLYRIPVIPTLFLKSHQLFSLPKNKLMISATSSGTKGKRSEIGFDTKSLYLALRMVLKTFSYYKLISPIPTNYIVLGYQPAKRNQMSAVKTAYGATLLTPALHREYALKDTGSEYELNIEGIKSALIRYSKMNFPVRFMGFPAYMYFLLQALRESNIKLRLPKKSKVFLAGGWKQFFAQRVDKRELYRLIEDTLGIDEANCKEFFGAVEHPVLYCDCKNHHFHVPVYSRVIIRDVNTFMPVENGKPGIVNLISPLVGSAPLVSIVTDDLAIMHGGEECGCGIKSPYFEILGRVGLQDIKTCAAGAAELLEGVKL